MQGRYRNFILAVIGIAALTGALYFPFLSNGLIFDDYGLYRGGGIYDYAQMPFSFRSRTFPYFTLGFISVLNSAIEMNRIVSLLLHVFCSWMLFALIVALLNDAGGNSSFGDRGTKEKSKHALILAFFSASWFAIHPVAVYGAGYLAQRTILFATLFSLLSLWFYRRSFAENRTVDVVSAALFYSLAVFSKEHAIMLPLATLPLAALYEASWRANFKRIALYLLLCMPAALTVWLATKHIVASSYEPDVAAMLPQMQNIAVLAQSRGEWLVSIVLQAGFFFDYLAFWLVPDVRFLSADMRFDFVHIWSSWWVFPKAFLFFLSPLVAIYFLRKKGLIALFCCGFLYSWFLFLTELAAVRFQEPFVLYRSYLWAPGYAMMLVAVCARAPRRWLLMAAIPLFVVFFLLARDRLTSLSTEANVWKDAAAKLESPTLVGSDRIFYNRGLAYMREKQYDDAIADFSRTVQLNPKVAQAYYNRALAYYALEQYAEAMVDLELGLLLNAKDASAQYVRGLILERRGCAARAKQAFTASMAMGNHVAKLKLEEMEKKNTVSGQGGASVCPD
ncbi:MAG: tetratricopeptide repeat protein [Pseudomonadota bacterium]